MKEKTPNTDLAQLAADGKLLNKNNVDESSEFDAFYLISKIKNSFTAAKQTYTEEPVVKAGDRWGHLTIIDEIGAGGMGLVYKAYDDLLDRPVAVKFLNPKSNIYTSSEAFIAEARRLAKIRHPNVLAIHGANTHANTTGFWSELLEGKTLDLFLESKLSWEKILYLSDDLSKALNVIHQNEIVHGDIKPLNIMVDDSKGAILMDFGSGSDLNQNINHISSSTPLIMAPELFKGGSKSKQSDVYALGVVYYFLSSHGQFPYKVSSLKDLQEKISGGTKIDFKVLRGTKTWKNLIASMLHNKPKSRPTAEVIEKSINDIINIPAKRNKKIAIYSLFLFLTGITSVTLYSNHTLEVAKQKIEMALNETNEVNKLMSTMLSSVSPVVSGKDLLMLDVVDDLVLNTKNNNSISVNVKARSLFTLAHSLNSLGQFTEATELLNQIFNFKGLKSQIKVEVICAEVDFMLGASKDKNTIISAQKKVQLANEIITNEFIGHAYIESLINHANARINLAQEDWTSAEKRLKQALNYWLTLPPNITNNRMKGILYNDLGLVSNKQGKFALAADHFALAVDYHESFDQKLNSNILAIKNNWAINLRMSGHVDDAIDLYQELISQAKQLIGPDHKKYLFLMQNLAAALNDANRVSESIKILESINPQVVKHFGKNSQAYVGFRTTLANNLKSLKNFAEAELIYHEVIKLSSELFDENHSEVLLNQYNLAELYYESNQPEKSLLLIEDRLPVAIKSLGDKHIVSIYMLEAQAWSNHLLGYNVKAKNVMTEVIELKKTVFGLNNELTLKSIDKLKTIESYLNK